MRMGEFDRIDDELFALDPRFEGLITPPSALSELTTVRLDVRAPAQFDSAGAHHRPTDDVGGEMAIVVAFSALLVVVVAIAGIVLWWWR